MRHIILDTQHRNASGFKLESVGKQFWVGGEVRQRQGGSAEISQEDKIPVLLNFYQCSLLIIGCLVFVLEVVEEYSMEGLRG